MYLNNNWGRSGTRTHTPFEWLLVFKTSSDRPTRIILPYLFIVERRGFEPLGRVSPTTGLANQLNKPLWHLSIIFVVEIGFEPTGQVSSTTWFPIKSNKPLWHSTMLY